MPASQSVFSRFDETTSQVIDSTQSNLMLTRWQHVWYLIKRIYRHVCLHNFITWHVPIFNSPRLPKPTPNPLPVKNLIEYFSIIRAWFRSITMKFSGQSKIGICHLIWHVPIFNSSGVQKPTSNQLLLKHEITHLIIAAVWLRSATMEFLGESKFGMCHIKINGYIIYGQFSLTADEFFMESWWRVSNQLR